MAEWTTYAEVSSILSELGVDSRTDDIAEYGSSAPEALVLDAIEEATDFMRRQLRHRYPDAEMENNRWVRRRCSYVACYILSRRRGNPAQYREEYDAIAAELKDIRLGIEFVPDAVPSYTTGPAMSNQNVDHRYTRAKLRTDPNTSTGDATGDRDWDMSYPTIEPS